ncbi:hypothetical protein TNCV_1240361 [Trichonephila clavipes]|uniref:Uncharacterized protein n=1 Tax=Trichonephila clavipes TaxID=2585209 RepID=A0A8X6WE54_TRICX|nr:hypothetical protein TNCV_1240361 [Trichonephila clavipes]
MDKNMYRGHDQTLNGIVSAKLVLELLAAGDALVASVLWYMRYWRHNHTQTKTPSLGYADALQDAATGWSSDDSASESEKKI